MVFDHAVCEQCLVLIHTIAVSIPCQSAVATSGKQVSLAALSLQEK